MTLDPGTKLVRRVVTGLNSEGRSVIVSDGKPPNRVQRPTGIMITELWRADALPTDVADAPEENGESTLTLASCGISVRIAVFPPDKGVDPADAAEYENAMENLYGDQGDETPNAIPGMHRTDTVDIVTVVDGEIWLLMEEGETLLHAGDTLVQRGTRHAWRNRGDRPCTLTSTTLPATRRKR